MEDQERLAQAKRYIKQLLGFYIHATVFVLVNLGLMGLNLFLGRPYWFGWVLLGWGLGLAGHAILIYVPRLTFVSDWQERKLRQLMSEKPKP